MMAPASPPVSGLFGERKILNLGSGKKRFPDAVNLDLVADTQPDVVWDLNQFPWPLPDNHFERVRAYDVLEHLENTLLVMQEIHRVCAPGARVEITVPHFSSGNAFTDPTHRHYFSLFSFHYFTGENQLGFYTSVKFNRKSIILLPDAPQSAGLAARQPLSRSLRTPLGVDLPGVVSFLPTRGGEVAAGGRPSSWVTALCRGWASTSSRPAPS
jgi:hypothetical protein